MNGGNAGIARQAQQRIVVAEQPVECVRRRQHQQIVRPPPALIPPQQVGRPWILAAPRTLRSAGRRAPSRPKAEIEFLAGNRVDGVRCIPHQDEARVEVAMRVQRAEPVAPATAHDAHRAERCPVGGRSPVRSPHHRARACAARLPCARSRRWRKHVVRRLPRASALAHIGNCANGPEGRKCSSATL